MNVSVIKNIVLSIVLMIFSNLFAQNTDKPKLIVGIVVDQMRAEYLYRFQDNYGEYGFKRLIKDGFNVKNTHYNYIPTATGPGHATIYSGTTPASHGIVANDWYDRQLQRTMYCAEDTTTYLINNKNIKASAINKYSRSPKNLLTTNIADELKLFTNGRSKVIGLSLKDRGAIFPSGHMADYAFWYNTETGDFITSSYYKNTLPDWLITFNNQRKPDDLLNEIWDTYLPIERYINSTMDDAPFEYIFKGKTSPVFPYNLKKIREENNNFALLTQVPQGNTLLTQMVMATIEGEKLGQDEEMDFLSISYSSTDYIGHNFGIRSKELEDTYIRLDKELAELLIYLDDTIGKDDYLLFLTADHAASDNPVFLEQKKLPGNFFDPDKIGKDLNDYLNQQFGNENYISYSDKTQIYIMDKFRMDQDLLKASATFLKIKVPGIKDVYVPNLIETVSKNKSINIFFSNSYNNLNSGDFLLNFQPGWIEYREFGTTHGTAYNSDTNVPLLWYGHGILKGETVKLYTIDQIASTISFLVGIPLPDSSNNKPIIELFEN